MRSLKILILEPNPFQLMALHQMLNAIGIYDVLTAPTLSSAKRSLERRGAVDIAICNPQLKGGDGLALITHLVARQKARSLILLGMVAPSLLADLEVLMEDDGVRLLGSLPTPVSAVLMRKLLDRYLSSPRHPVSA
ncbi:MULTISPECIES: response regulator [Pseudomonas]|uniref:response regulator n=1 Tax=Pseudomonas TaxID=286 RepID=UPI00003C72A6|nr:MULTISPECIES: response regulator [Pseudomonas]MBL0794798.1 response regulator [Pseudomonas sp. B7]MBX8622315.1 response regulator [Pseudomonas glycinae]MBY9023022.1 response regulator [Pseudomonas fluorescens]MBY9029014.1 response regulator [Pseudomonas fluorescens]MBY9034768.1 response regulator [Pseudomonas fluorescens]